MGKEPPFVLSHLVRSRLDLRGHVHRPPHIGFSDVCSTAHESSFALKLAKCNPIGWCTYGSCIFLFFLAAKVSLSIDGQSQLVMYLFMSKHFIQLIFHYTKSFYLTNISLYCSRCFTRLFSEQHFIVLIFYYTIGDGITRFIYLQTILVLMFHYAIIYYFTRWCLFMYLFCKYHFLVLIHLHLADAFIQSDLQCIQVIHFLSVCVPWESNPQPLRC